MLVQRDGAGFALGWVFWLTTLLLVAAAVVYFLPPAWLDKLGWRGVVAAPGSASSAAAPAGQRDGSAVAGAARDAAVRCDAAAGPAGACGRRRRAAPLAARAPRRRDGAIQVRTSAPSWIEVTDARGRALLSRLVQPGEALGLDGEAPFRVRIGNAAGTQLSFRGQPVELAATRDNVASVELK